MIGGGRSLGTGYVLPPYIGAINRLYVYHAPSGTFSTNDYETIRTFVKNAAPLP
jgi:hypothetical protein